MKNALIENIVRLHTTELGAERIRRNLGLTEDPVEWCRSKSVITVNAGSYTIITAHREK